MLLYSLIMQSQVQRRSLDFERSSSQSLSISDANFGAYNLDKLSFSLWYKRESTSSSQYLISQGTGSATDAFQVYFNLSNKLEFTVSNGTTHNHGALTTTATFADTSLWHHLLLWWDRNNATANNRMRIWSDGTEITAFDTRNNPTNAMNNSTNSIYIGADSGGASTLDGKVYQPCMFSNQLTDISSLYNLGRAKDVKHLPGLHFLLDTNVRDSVTDDYVLAADWTNNNTVTKSIDVP